jgi:pimeloyl-ACP methyl ester carboxylesterase
VLSPVVVGHSIAAIVATAYAARHPTRGIINVDQPLQAAPFAAMVQSLADKLRGPGSLAQWRQVAKLRTTIRASIHATHTARWRSCW